MVSKNREHNFVLMANKAFIFDLNGTMINDMAFHEQAWFDVLNNDLHAGLSMEQVKANMYGKNEELYDRVFGSGKYSKEEKDFWTLKKEKVYQQKFLPHLQLINGLGHFLSAANQKSVRMGIGTAATLFNLNYVLDNLPIRNYFAAIVSAEDVSRGKPNPEVFEKCADKLGVPYSNCLVFEDSPKGVQAAASAGMKAVAITSYHPKEDFTGMDNILFIIDDYSDTRLQSLL